jgi:hypothetical protein
VISAITGWENLVEDFFWVPAFLVWLAEISPIGIFVFAVWSFFKQRAGDREDQLRLEQRKTYLEYVKSCSDLMRLYRNYSLNDLDSFLASESTIHEAKRKNDESFRELMVIGREEIVLAASDINNILHGFLDGLTEQCKSVRENPPTNAELEKMISSVAADTAVKYDGSIEKFVNLVRKLEFGSLNDLKFSTRYTKSNGNED